MPASLPFQVNKIPQKFLRILYSFNLVSYLVVYRKIAIGCAAFAMLLAGGCTKMDDDRIPSMPVSINLADSGLWNVYGVSGIGVWNIFVRELQLPKGFTYTGTTYTGFGGVLLIGGMDPFSGDTNVPLAYDLACPVECRRDVRVYIDSGARMEAVCPECGSHYDVVMGAGASVSGPAFNHKPRYGLTRYNCYEGQLGGYMIRD